MTKEEEQKIAGIKKHYQEFCKEEQLTLEGIIQNAILSGGENEINFHQLRTDLEKLIRQEREEAMEKVKKEIVYRIDAIKLMELK